MTSKSRFIQDILDSALENSRHNNSWYEEPELKSDKTCIRCHKSYIEEKTRIRTEDDAVIIRRLHSTNDDDLISFCEVKMVGGGLL